MANPPVIDRNVKTLEHETYATDTDLGTVVKTLTKILGGITGSFGLVGATNSLTDSISLPITNNSWTQIPVLTGQILMFVQNHESNANPILWSYANDTDDADAVRILPSGIKDRIITDMSAVKVYLKLPDGTSNTFDPIIERLV